MAAEPALELAVEAPTEAAVEPPVEPPERPKIEPGTTPPPPPKARAASRPAGPQVPREEPPEEGAPMWTVTFGDMMSLLLTFFILLFSMSEIEVEKFRDAMNSLHEGFGESTVDMGQEPPPPPVAPTDSADTETAVSEVIEAKLEEIAEALRTFVAENGLEQNLVVDKAEDGVYLQIRDVALFQPGGADIEASSAYIVERLSAVLTAVDIPVTVAGHTDNVPIRNSRFQSNWELSAARAAGVARRLVSIGHDADQIQVTAFGEYRPIDTNDTAEGRARNRRVEVFYSRQAIEDSLLSASAETPPDSTAAAGASAAEPSGTTSSDAG